MLTTLVYYPVFMIRQYYYDAWKLLYIEDAFLNPFTLSQYVILKSSKYFVALGYIIANMDMIFANSNYPHYFTKWYNLSYYYVLDGHN